MNNSSKSKIQTSREEPVLCLHINVLHRNSTENQKQQVLWSDDFKFENSGQSGEGQERQHECLLQSVKHSGGSASLVRF